MVAGPLETLKEPMMTKLTDTQLIILGKACERKDGAVYPVATKLNGAALAKVLNSLIAKSLIKEVRAKRDETVWRLDDEDRPLTLYATPAAYPALGIEQNETADADSARPERKRTCAVKGRRGKDMPARTRTEQAGTAHCDAEGPTGREHRGNRRRLRLAAAHGARRHRRGAQEEAQA
jgi:hypothetical protein